MVLNSDRAWEHDIASNLHAAAEHEMFAASRAVQSKVRTHSLPPPPCFACRSLTFLYACARSRPGAGRRRSCLTRSTTCASSWKRRVWCVPRLIHDTHTTRTHTRARAANAGAVDCGCCCDCLQVGVWVSWVKNVVIFGLFTLLGLVVNNCALPPPPLPCALPPAPPPSHDHHV